jgi:ribulose-phosphate 3-epimerase
VKVTVSVLKSKLDSKETIKKVGKTDADYIHVDVMDGQFIPHHSLSIYEVNNLFENCKKQLDIHLMVDDVKTHIDAFKHLNVHSFIFHVETKQNIEELIEYVHSNNIKVGLAINPETQTDSLLPYLSELDLILIMGVTPGLGGQKLIKETVDKAFVLKGLRSKFNYHYEIGIDGGVNLETRPLLNDCDYLISGSYVCMSDNYQEKIDSLR